MSVEDFHTKIDKVPIDEWREESTGETYRDTATMLVEKGFSQDETLKLLFKLYYAAVDSVTMLIARGFSQDESRELLNKLFQAAADEWGEEWLTDPDGKFNG